MRIWAGLSVLALMTGCATVGPQADMPPPPSATVASYPAVPAPDAAALARMIRVGEVTAEAAVEAYLARLDAYDRQGPRLQAVIALNPTALAEARLMDAEAAEGRFRGPLHGVPVLVKDNIDTEDMPTTAGSLALLDNHTGRNSPLVARLKAQGAIILGKTNLSEWANFRSNKSISGWSAVGGQTRNPHSLDRSPCGSSSGSGVAVAANFVPLAIGTETNGSIQCPAAMNGVYGLKPTVGLIPRTHIVPISPTQDTAGPMGRSVRDLALALNAMAGSDASDPATAEADARRTDYVAALDRGVEGIRIGVLRYAIGNAPGVSTHFEQSIETLRTLGATIVDIAAAPKTPESMWDDAFFVLQAEFKTSLNDYLASAPDGVAVRTLSDLIAFNESVAARELALFDQDILVSSEATGGMADPGYAPAIARLRMATRTEGIDALLKANGVDVLIAPSRPPAFMVDVVYGDQYPSTGVGADWMAAIAGYPNMTVPMGTDGFDLPLGLSIMSTAWQEELILRVGHALTLRRPMMVAPMFVDGARNSPAYQDVMGAWQASNLRGTLQIGEETPE